MSSDFGKMPHFKQGNEAVVDKKYHLNFAKVLFAINFSGCLCHLAIEKKTLDIRFVKLCQDAQPP